MLSNILQWFHLKKNSMYKSTEHLNPHRWYVRSSIVNDGIRDFYTFLQEDPTRTKSTKRTQANKSKDSFKCPWKASKRQKFGCLA